MRAKFFDDESGFEEPGFDWLRCASQRF